MNLHSMTYAPHQGTLTGVVATDAECAAIQALGCVLRVIRRPGLDSVDLRLAPFSDWKTAWSEIELLRQSPDRVRAGAATPAPGGCEVHTLAAATTGFSPTHA